MILDMGEGSDISGLGVLATTGDAFRSSRMQRMLSNLTTSYKLYWLAGVFEEAVAGRGTSRSRGSPPAWWPQRGTR